MRRVSLTIALALLVIIAFSQNIGIGTTSPTNKLHVAGVTRSDTVAFGTQLDDLRSVNNQAYTFLLINAMKEQQAQIEKPRPEMDDLKKLVEQLIKK